MSRKPYSTIKCVPGLANLKAPTTFNHFSFLLSLVHFLMQQEKNSFINYDLFLDVICVRLQNCNKNTLCFCHHVAKQGEPTGLNFFQDKL
jgi:hypothetical protein